MSSALNLAVSPYHLATRELTAAVAMTLADRAVTIVPQPAEGRSREDVRHAFERVPRLLRVLEAWRWSGPLWRQGLIAGEYERRWAGDALSEMLAEVLADPALSKLSAVAAVSAEPGEAADRWLDSFCADLLRGGPDPILATTATGALDRFAVSHSLIAVRGSTDSIAQRTETRLVRRTFSVAIPVMSRSAGGRILELRSVLNSELAQFRGALARAWSEDLDVAGGSDEIAAAAAKYAASFEDWFARVARDDENAERTMRAYVSLTGGFLPADTAVACARAAVRRATNAGLRAGRPSTRSPSQSTEATSSRLRVLTVRPMNVRPV